MTPTELITAVQALKIHKDPGYGSDLQQFERLKDLRDLIFNSSDVDDEIRSWMNEEPSVNFDEIVEFRKKNGK